MRPVLLKGQQIELQLKPTISFELVFGLGADHLRIGALLGMLQQLGTVWP